MIQPLSTRLFPNGVRPEDVRITGIAARCDWVVVSSAGHSECRLVRNVPGTEPRHVFVSLRNVRQALDHLSKHVLPKITTPFVLVTGSEDVTLPRQTDARWPAFDADARNILEDTLNHPLLQHWFVENLDDASDARMSPLPLGAVDRHGTANRIAVPDCPPLADRPLRALCHNVLRDGPQWRLRHEVSARAAQHWSDFCTVRTDQVSQDAYYAEVEDHAFVLCVRGGGLDPSDKAWLTLLHGAIPIIESSALDAAYVQLPVVIVPHWSRDILSRDRLAAWRDARVSEFDDPDRRAEMIRRLGLDYWWDRIARRARS